mgnify:CR=1 FL=1
MRSAMFVDRNERRGKNKKERKNTKEKNVSEIANTTDNLGERRFSAHGLGPSSLIRKR